jgi:hypothetical protein
MKFLELSVLAIEAREAFVNLVQAREHMVIVFHVYVPQNGILRTLTSVRECFMAACASGSTASAWRRLARVSAGKDYRSVSVGMPQRTVHDLLAKNENFQIPLKPGMTNN